MEVVQYWQTGRLGAVWSGFWLAGVSGSRCVTVGIDGIRFSDEAARRAVAVCLSGREEPVFVSSFRSSGGRAYLIVDGVLGEVVVKVSHGSLSQRLLSVTRWAALTDSALLSPLCSPCSVFDPVYGELLVSFSRTGRSLRFLTPTRGFPSGILSPISMATRLAVCLVSISARVSASWRMSLPVRGSSFSAR